MAEAVGERGYEVGGEAALDTVTDFEATLIKVGC